MAGKSRMRRRSSSKSASRRTSGVGATRGKICSSTARFSDGRKTGFSSACRSSGDDDQSVASSPISCPSASNLPLSTPMSNSARA